MLIARWGSCGLIAALSILSAGQFRFQVYRNPSLFVTGMAEDRAGRLWIASQQGLYRFDGFHFEPITAPGVTWTSDVDITADGTVWISTREGLLRYCGQFDTVFRDPVEQVASIGNSLLFRGRYGTWMRDAAGHQSQPPGCEGDFYYGQILVGADRTFQLVCRETPIGNIGRVQPDPGLRPVIGRIPGTWARVVTDRSGDTWLESLLPRKLYRLRPGARLPAPHPMPRYDAPYQNRLVSDTGDAAWFLGNPTLNLTHGFSLDRNRDAPRITQLATGLRGSIWIAELGAGLVRYRLGEQWQRWTSEETGTKNFGLLAGAPGQPPRIYSSSGLSAYRDGTLQPTPRPGTELRSVAPLPDGDLVAVAPSSGLLILHSDGHVKHRVPIPLVPKGSRRNWADVYQSPKADGHGRVWIGGPVLLELLQRDGRWWLIPVDLPRQHDELAAADIQVDPQGRPWVGYAEGIAYLDGDRWRLIATDQPVRDVASLELQGDDIWVAHTAPGRYSRLHRRGNLWTVESFSDPESNLLRSSWLRIDSRGWIWRGVDDGVRVANGSDLRHWLYLRKENGLDVGTPTPGGFYEDAGGSIWIAGSSGVAHFTPDAGWFNVPQDAPPPVIGRLSVSGRQIRAWAGGLNMPAFQPAPLEYRLLPVAETWRGTANGNLEFVDLPAAAYTLEVRYAGLGTSPVARREIRVGPPVRHLPRGALAGTLAALALSWLLLLRTSLYARWSYRMKKLLHIVRARIAGRGPVSLPAMTPGNIFDQRFEIMRLESGGGFSRVYEACDLQSGQRVALKVIGGELREQGWIRNRFSHEQNALRAIHHRNVVPLLDGGVDRYGSLYLVMPFLEGITLRRRLQDGPVPASEAVSILRRLADALDIAHPPRHRPPRSQAGKYHPYRQWPLFD